ncbi:MAG: NmrA family NAD(P)-binding protein [Halodesulfurarchaeum sp.]
MSDRVLVTGATGTVGSAVVPELYATDLTVRAASRAAEPDGFADAIGTVQFSFSRPETWGPALRGVDRLFLLWPPGTDVSSVTAFLDAAARRGIDHVTFLSILGAGSLPVLPHRRIEGHLNGIDVDGTVLRSAYFAQNLAGIHRPEILDRGEIFVPAGDGAMGIIDARDVGAVAAGTISRPSHWNRTYTLTGPRALTFHEVAQIARDVLDRPIRYADPSPLEFGYRLYRRGIDLRLVGFMIAEYTATRLGLASRTTRDVERVLGVPPRSVRTFFEDYQARFREPAH